MAPNINEIDLYEVLNLLPSASESEIKKAYRKKALKCHPDKNPDDPKAPEQWEIICKALEILTDEKARALYDKVLKAKKANELRNRALEAKRRKVKEDLEAREASYKDETELAQDAARKLEQEIRRLRDEGSKILAREQELMKEQLKAELQQSSDGETAKLKVKWKSKKQDESNGGYSHEYLMRAFGKYGRVTNLIVSRKKNGSAIVEFESPKAAEWAVRNEMGNPRNPLQLTWLSGQPQAAREDATNSPKPNVAPGPDEDYELMVLKRLQEAHQKQQTSSPDDGEEQNRFAEEGTTNPNPHVLKTQDNLSKPLDGHLRTEPPIGSQTGGLTGDTAEEGGTGVPKRTLTQTTDARDFESVAMMRMRQAQERKRLIEEMMKEEEDS